MNAKLTSMIVLLLTMVTQNTWATLSGSGTQADPYLITSVADWHELRTNTSYYGEDKFFKLTNDIQADQTANIDSPTLSKDVSFGGTFDGNGHAISLHYATKQKYDGLFPNVRNLTIKNLHVSGNINTTNECAGGLIGKATGTVNIHNCQVSTNIVSSYEGNGYHGGFVAAVKDDGHLNISNCIFNGQFNGENTSKWGGFIGWIDEGASADIDSLFFRPSTLVISQNSVFSHPFSLNLDRCNSTNCLYSFYISKTGIKSIAYPERFTNVGEWTPGAVVEQLGTDNWYLTGSNNRTILPRYKFTVFYDANGGTGAPTAQTKTLNSDLTLSNVVPTKENYSFTGWNTKADGSGTTYASSADYTTESSTTLFAQWALPHAAAWTANDSEAANWQLPTATPYEGQYLTLRYTGSRHVKSVSFVGVPKITTAPTAKTDIIYSGAAEPLIEAGAAQYGTMMYRLGATGEYTDAIPTATATGNYTVYYKVVGAAGFRDLDEGSINVTIHAVGHELSASAVGDVVGSDGLAYDVDKKDYMPSGVTAAGVVTYKDTKIGYVVALYNCGGSANSNGTTYQYANLSEALATTTAVSGRTWTLGTKAAYASALTDQWDTAIDCITAASGRSLSGLSYMSATTAEGDKIWRFLRSDWAINEPEGYVRPIFFFTVSN